MTLGVLQPALEVFAYMMTAQLASCSSMSKHRHNLRPSVRRSLRPLELKQRAVSHDLSCMNEVSLHTPQAALHSACR
jgi:type IV pilus biogenesis protein CpaD/CtpE